ncbi:hypothetical protein SASPL_126714 [Salvia splendens]|uniref:Tyrosine-specific transport protein n=1 Tax=Salvia splendens TaxID=180675 RepID=A0A8X8ZR91_SALSN|nr:hypothetical protein SASPL_126714 [Salvia splendens]
MEVRRPPHPHQKEHKLSTLINPRRSQSSSVSLTTMLSSFSASSLANIRKSSFLLGNPTHITKIKNPPFSVGISGAPNFTHLFIDSSPRASVKCFSQQEKQQLLQQDDEEVHEFQRLFSNLNQATLKREPGSLSSSIFLVAGTTVTTGLLIAEVNVNMMRELGSGGVSLPIVDVFSVLAIATSYIGFVLGLSDFLADLSGFAETREYVLTLVPPLILSLLDPEIFFKALDFAGTYGVLVLFGVLPAAMSWSDRYSGSSETPTLVPGGKGKVTLSLVMAGSALVILTDNFGQH